jgi:hypothetical protein
MGCGSSTVAPNKPGLEAVDAAHRIPDSATPVTPKSPQRLIYTEAADNYDNHFAASQRGDVGTSKPLIVRSGVGVNKLVGMWGSTPLIVALQYGQKELAELLLSLEDVGDLNHTNDKGASPLVLASMEGMVDIVSALKWWLCCATFTFAHQS